MAAASMHPVDNVNFFSAETISNKSLLVCTDASTVEEKPSLLARSLSKLIEFVSPISLVQSAATKTSRIRNFVLLSLLAAFLFMFALTSLPLVLIFPEKFALSFSLASLVMHFALSNLKGSFEEYIQALVSNKDYSTVSTVYVVSLFFTLYASVYLGNYIIVLAACGLQLFSIGWFLSTMFPRGSQGAFLMLKYTLKACPGGKSIIPV